MSQPPAAMPDRMRIARAIIVCHVLLIAIVVALYMSDSLLPEEFTPLLTLLTPVTTLYAGTVVRYLSERIKAGVELPPEPPVPHAGLVRSLIVGHFALMLALIMAKAVFNWIEFSAMTALMTIAEALFGGYLGTITGAVFGNHSRN